MTLDHQSIDDADALISLTTAGALAGLAPGTLRIQAQRGRLATTKIANRHLTTRRWLDDYLRRVDAGPYKHNERPEGYVPPAPPQEAPPNGGARFPAEG